MRLAITTCLLVFLASNSTAASWQPAGIGDSQYSLPNKIEVPVNIAEGEHFVRCEVKLTRKGIVQTSFCYELTKSTSKALVVEVNRAVRGAQFEPAFEDGKAVRVFMQAIVVVEVEGTTARVSAFPNDGTNRAKYGWDHVSPQRLNKFTWSRAPANRDTRKSRIWMHLHIDESGLIVRSDIRDAGQSSAAVRNSLARDIRRMDFRPGYFQGKPVAMEYIELARYR